MTNILIGTPDPEDNGDEEYLRFLEESFVEMAVTDEVEIRKLRQEIAALRALVKVQGRFIESILGSMQ